MFSKIRLLIILACTAGIAIAGEPSIELGGQKQVAMESDLLEIPGTSDLYTREISIQATNPSVDVPDADYTREQLSFDLGNMRGFVKIKFKPESFFGKNINLLNNNVRADRVFFSRSTLDINFALEYGKACYGHEALEFFMTWRSKALWGNAQGTLGTSNDEVKIVNSLTGPHNHTLARQFPWIREVWVRFNINDALGLSFRNQHTFTLGSFPFQLGRGISLGAAYAVNQGVLGFFSDNTIDQFAYGYNFSGEFVEDILAYDLYGAILQDQMDSFRTTTAKIRAQELGHRLNPERGPGRVDYVIAGRLKWVPIDNDDITISYEPYVMYNNSPELRLEFIGDSSAKLATFGCAGEFAFGNFEWGFDGAFNAGSQHVRGWDRNRVQLQNTNAGAADSVIISGVPTTAIINGGVFEVNSRVVNEDPRSGARTTKAIFVPNSPNQKAIEDVQIALANNGLPIPGTTPQLYNDLDRFRNDYRNKFDGWMFVIDAAYTFESCDDLKLAVETGIASGDEDPNKDLEDPNDSRKDGNYKGFIGLQEIYTGNRVKSVFLLGGAGRLPRPLSTPRPGVTNDTIPSQTSNFTNIAYVGTGLDWKPCCGGRYFQVKPNLLGYWQQHRTKAFDRVTGQSSPTRFARAYLGTEVNCFVDTALFKDFSMFAVGSVFIPGGHYKDIRGKPLNAEQQRILDRADKTGFDLDLLPLLGTDVAWTINIGMEAKF
ncbi:MAG: hypothetical protein AB7F19_03875 [Candidatus Babeliales bacterium]